ncbi:MAG: DUF4251 domain-containing protein [Bacteroidaceae bacterium]|nr:DUF4251 domain-containing protein [Bacteroidaceae bacterium]MBR5891345.1 DUF4251 domain-containing protein [Bacteroidaceae bacterium]
MRRFLFVAVVMMAFFQFQAIAQRDRMTKAEREAAWRAERLKKRAAERARIASEDSIAFVQAVEALRTGSWALEASNITFNNGVTRFVTSSTNYVAVNAGEGTVQTAFNNTNITSPNGLGGVTLEGTVWGERMGTDDDGNIFYSCSIQGSGISAIITVTLTAGSNQASATVNANYSGNKMVFNGYLYPYNSAGIFEGQPTY